jgi:hypothetical protein
VKNFKIIALVAAVLSLIGTVKAASSQGPVSSQSDLSASKHLPKTTKAFCTHEARFSGNWCKCFHPSSSNHVTTPCCQPGYKLSKYGCFCKLKNHKKISKKKKIYRA